MKRLFLIILSLLTVSTLTFSQKVSADFILSSGRTTLTDPKLAQLYSLSAEGDGSIKKANLYGQFNYSYLAGEDAGYSMLYTPGSYSYFYTDTIRGKVRREQYHVAAGISYPFSDSFSVGLDGSLMLGSKAKLRDIRNKNTVNDIHFSPFVSWRLLTVSYLFSKYREEVALKRFGPDVVIPITSCEGLFFGSTEAFGSQHAKWYYQTTNHGVSISLGFKIITPTIRYIHSSSDIDTRVYEERIGREEGNFISLSTVFSTGTTFFGGSAVVSYSNKNSFSPVGKKGSNGNTHRFEYYGEVKRHNTELLNVNLQDIIGFFPSDKSTFKGVGLSYQFSKKTQTHFILPQEFKQDLTIHKISCQAAYCLPFGLVSGCLLSFDSSNGNMLSLKNKNLQDQKYNHNAALLEKEWDFLIASHKELGLNFDYAFNLPQRGSVQARLALNFISSEQDNKRSINFNLSYKL